MKKKDKKSDPMAELKRTENGIDLRTNTRFFNVSEGKEADEYAREIRSYKGTCFDGNRKWIGYYVPR